MGREIVYCDVCGERILEQDFNTGRALVLLNKNYCAVCKDKAVRNIGIDESLADLPPAPPVKQPTTGTIKSVPPVPRPSSGMMRAVPPAVNTRKAPTGVAKAPSPPTRTRPAPAVPRPPTALYAGIGVAGAALIGIVLLLVVGGGGPSKRPEPSAEDAAATVMTRLRAMADAKGDPEKILAECRSAQPVVAGTRHEDELRRIEKETAARAKQAKAASQIERLLADHRKIVEGDPQFARLDEARRLLDDALGAARDAGTREKEVADLRSAYLDRFQKAAREAGEAARRDAEALVRDERYEDVIAAIERFPLQFRSTEAWPALQAILERCRNALAARRQDPPPKGGDPFPAVDPPAAGEWTSVFDGKTMDLWYRLVQGEEQENSWRVRDGLLVGESSYKEQGDDTTARDFILLRYANIADGELEFKVRAEGRGFLVGGRFLVQSRTSIVCALTLVPATDWVTVKMRIAGRSVSATIDGRPSLPFNGTDTMPDAGRVFFAVYPGSKVQMKELRFLRTK